MAFLKRCGDTCGIFGGKKCKERRECACTVCSSLEAVNLNLAEACYKACNSLQDENRPKSKEDFLCKMVGGETLFNNYALTDCGYDPLNSSLHKIKEEEQATIDKANEPLKKTIGVIVLLIVVALGYLLFHGKKKAK